MLGMPGTGKTFVIVLLLKILIDRGDKVLLSSYTHSALDNLLHRFVTTFPSYKHVVARISANKFSVNERVRDLYYDRKKYKTIAEIENNINSKKVFAVTCLSASSFLLSMPLLSHYRLKTHILDKIDFDVCVIDEASQVLEPICLGPLFNARKFVLIGDYFQVSSSTLS